MFAINVRLMINNETLSFCPCKSQSVRSIRKALDLESDVRWDAYHRLRQSFSVTIDPRHYARSSLVDFHC